jgi:hypothetical protein
MINHAKPLSLFDSATVAPEEQAVLAPIQSLFDGASKRDRKAMLDVLLPHGTAAIVINGRAVLYDFSAWVDRLPGGTRKIEERIYDPWIRIDEDVAIVWARYEFLIDGKVEQYGTEVFGLIYCDDRWLIASIAYNNRRFGGRKMDA